MKKKRKALLEKINEDKGRLHEDLKIFFLGLSNKKGYEAYDNLLQILRGWKTMEIPMELDFTIITNGNNSMCERLNTNRKLFVGLTLIYAFMSNLIYDDKKNKKSKRLPDNLMYEIEDFKDLLEKFLFS